MFRQIRFLLLAAAVALCPLWVCSARADQADDLNDQLRDAQADQEHIQISAKQVGQELDALIGEFRANGLQGGSDFKTLLGIRDVLGKLSDQEMAQVIHLLEQARGQSTARALHDAAMAQTDQSNIIGQLQTLLNQYQRQQALLELADRFQKLAARQKTNLDSTVRTARAVLGNPAAAADPALKDSLQVQANEQNTLQSDVNAGLRDLAEFVSRADDTDAAVAKEAQAVAAAGNLADQATAAVQALKNGLLSDAAGQEKSVHDLLRRISRVLGMPQDDLGRLRQAEREIEQQIADQKQVQKATRQSPLNPAAAQDVESQQADVVANADLTREDLQNLAPAGAKALQNAQDQMQEARSAIADANKPAATQDQQKALDHLQEAKAAVAAAIAQEQARNDANQDNLNNLQDLSQQTAQLKQEQDTLKQTTAAAKNANDRVDDAQQQGQLEQKAQQLQQRAADAAPDAAQNLGDAAQHMDKAQAAIPKGNPAAQADAADSQQAASDALAQAQKQLDQDLDKLKQDAAQEKQLEALADKLRAIIDAQLKLQTQTGLTAAAKSGAPAAVDLAPPQTKLAGDTQQVRDQLPVDSTTTVGAPLDDAKTAMTTAATSLSGADAKSALPPQKDAVADLFKALAALDQQIQALQQALGQQPDDAQQMADLAKELNNAQQQLAQAQQAMNQPATQPSPAAAAQQAAQMQQQQQQIADALKQMQQNPPQGANGQQLQQAQGAAQQAAQDLAQNNLPQAAQAMQQAENGMQQAQQNQAQPNQPQQNQPQQNQAQQDQQNQPPAQDQANAQQPPGQLPQLEQQQQQLQQQLAQQMGQDPGQELGQQAQDMGKMAASPEAAAAPEDAQQAMQAAQQDMADAAGKEDAGDQAGAEQGAAKAQSAIAQAQAALGLAQSAMAQGPPDQGSDPNAPPGNAPGPGPGQGPPGPDPGQGPPGNQPGQADEQNPQGGTGQVHDAGTTAARDGAHNARGGAVGQFIGLPPRDRQALAHSQREKYPQQYGPMVEGYLGNLSDDENDRQ